MERCPRCVPSRQVSHRPGWGGGFRMVRRIPYIGHFISIIKSTPPQSPGIRSERLRTPALKGQDPSCSQMGRSDMGAAGPQGEGPAGPRRVGLGGLGPASIGPFTPQGRGTR